MQKREEKVFHDVPNRDGIIIEELSETKVDLKAIGSTYKTSKIELKSDEISIFKNHSGQDTPILILGIAKHESSEYAAIFDTLRKQGHIVGVNRKNGIITGFRDLDGLMDDEEWAVLNEFFQQKKIFESNRILRWTWNSMVNPKLNTHIPKHVLQKWNLDPNTMNRIGRKGK